jgi:hypothetical protein
MKKRFRIALALGIALLCLLSIVVLLNLRGRFLDGYYLAFEVNTDKESCKITKCIPLGAKEITVPETLGRYRVREIDAYAFANRAKLTAITLPDGIESIGMGAFYECERLQTIEIPNSVTAIGSYAFFNCSSLTGITLSANVSSVGTRVFEGCSSVTEAVAPVSAIGVLPVESITALVVNGGKSIGKDAFRSFQKLTHITIDPSVEAVDEAAFRGCYQITSATVPAWVCSALPKNNLQRVVINAGTRIEKNAFRSCHSLISITLPPEMTTIDASAFSNCYRLVEICNPSALEITKGSLDNGCIAQYALNVYTSAEEKSKVMTDADGYVFYADGDSCYLLAYVGEETSLQLPTSCLGKDYVIREYAFYMGSDITAMTIPEGVVGIASRAFLHCANIAEITFPDSLTFIGEGAFYECDKLEKVSLGRGLASVGSLAFDECYQLTQIYFRGTCEEWQQVATGLHWAYYTSAQEVVCTDGAIDLN